MAGDIRLEDDGVTLEGSVVHVPGSLLVQGAVQVGSILQAHGPFQAQGPVEMKNVVGVGTASPQRPLHVESGEIHSGGSMGGFSFSSRNKAAKAFFPEGLGDRWVLYADMGTARLWTSPIGDVFTVRWNGQVFVGGQAAGYSFGDQSGTKDFVQTPKNGERWTWFAKDKTARLRSGKDLLTVTLDGRLGVNVVTPERQLHVQGEEIHSGGSGAGFSFSDRKAKSFVAMPTKGERWVWYADGKAARLWSGGDKLSVSADGILDAGGVLIGGGKIVVATGGFITIPGSGPIKGSKIPETIDLVAEIIALRAAVTALQEKVKALGGKP